MAADRTRNLRDVPANASEIEMLLSFLDLQRNIVVWKTDGLDDNQIRIEHHPSGLTLMGLINHLTHVEKRWFQYRLLGDETVKHDESAAQWTVSPEVTSDEVVAAYRAACERSNAIARALSLDDMTRISSPKFGRPLSLRWVLMHMIEETARHAGHADLMREAIDGAVGSSEQVEP